jgi:putative transposase
MIDSSVSEIEPLIGTAPACRAVGASRTSVYRRRRPPRVRDPRPRRPPPRALTQLERARVLEHLNSPRFVDCSPAQVWATLLDEGTYLASERTMYRLLASEHGAGVRDRRDQLTHPPYARPELLASGPNELHTWDITKLKGPQLTVHADRGSSMTSKPVAFLLADLGVLKSHSRPYTSTDNPYSEAAFKTLKYRPDFPASFDSIDQAREHCRLFFDYYNHAHRHSGIGMLTPANVHHGQAETVHAARTVVLDAAYAANPDRFVNQPPHPPALPIAAWINKPDNDEADH